MSSGLPQVLRHSIRVDRSVAMGTTEARETNPTSMILAANLQLTIGTITLFCLLLNYLWRSSVPPLFIVLFAI